jgi:ABC-2 type transport system permease protein
MGVVRVRPIAGIVVRQLFLMRGSPARVIPLIGWVAIDIVLWGFISRYLNTFTHAGVDFIPQFLGAVLFWDFLTRVMLGITTAFFEDVWSRNFLNLFASPLSISEYVSGLVLTSIMTSAAGLIVMLVLATTVFGFPLFLLGLRLLPLLLVLFAFGIALGVIASAIVLRFGPASEWLVWPIPALLSPFAGVFYPLSTLPEWMQWIGRILPPSYVFEALRAAFSGGAVGGVSTFLIPLALAGAHLVFAGWFFARVYRLAVRTGLLARYTAESVG